MDGLRPGKDVEQQMDSAVLIVFLMKRGSELFHGVILSSVEFWTGCVLLTRTGKRLYERQITWDGD